MNVALATEIHDGEEQVPQLRFERCLTSIVRRKEDADLGQFFGHFPGRPFDIRPVEPDTRSAILKPVRPVERGEPGWKPCLD